MTELLIRKLVKNHEQVKDPAVRAAYGTAAVAVGIVTNLVLFAGKITVGLLFSSVSIIADAVNSLSDAGSSLITLVGVKISAKPADPDHPYGHERAEYICGFLVSLVILLLGIELCKGSVAKIFNPEVLQFSWLTVVILAVSALLKLWQGRFYKNIAARIDSTSILAAGVDSINDVVSTTAVLAALLISHFTGKNLDGIMGLAVALFILRAGVEIAKETLNQLLGEAPDEEMVKAIEEKIMSYEGVLGIHDLMVHCYGPSQYFATVHAEVSSSVPIMESHDLIDNIERDVMTDMGIHLVIHMDPLETDNPEIDRLRKIADEAVFEIDPKLSIHDFRVVTGPSHCNLIFDVTIPFKYPITPERLKTRIQEGLDAREKGLYAVVNIDLPYSGTMHTS
ncbi:MAG: cation transporter [Oscillospiraceae bacterium]|nr:cation transporter [Oscillospiraceae bacterium]